MDIQIQTSATVQNVVTLITQGLLSLILFLVFNYYSKAFIRRFLRNWSRSWLMFALYAFGSASLLMIRVDADYIVRLALGVLVQATSFLHVILLLLGCYQFIFYKPPRRKMVQILTASTTIIAILIVLAFSGNSEAFLQQYILRTGTRTFLAGFGFLFAGIIVVTNSKFSKGIGQKLLSVSFLTYGSLQTIYCFTVLASATGYFFSTPPYFGILDILSIGVMGLAMVMWLLEDERERLNKTNRELDAFLYSTSHDLRAPIASILGLTYIGKLELQEEKAQQYMGLIEERINKLNKVITDVLTLARTKKLDVKAELLDFNDLVKETISDIQFRKDTSKIKFIFDDQEPQRFYSDYSQVKVILSNLISNAVKYHNIQQEDPYIKVQLQQSPDKVEIIVEDNGQGIPDESLSKIFDMFYRASLSSEGTGLGLYIVKEALAKIRGNIDVQSVYGKGTTFTVVLEQLR